MEDKINDHKRNTKGDSGSQIVYMPVFTQSSNNVNTSHSQLWD